MAYSAHDVGLMPFVIHGVAHGFAVNSNALVLGRKSGVPLLQCTIEHGWINTDEHITDDGFAGHDIFAIDTTTAQTPERFIAEVFGLTRHGLVALHAAQRGCSSNAQYAR